MILKSHTGFIEVLDSLEPLSFDPTHSVLSQAEVIHPGFAVAIPIAIGSIQCCPRNAAHCMMLLTVSLLQYLLKKI